MSRHRSRSKPVPAVPQRQGRGLFLIIGGILLLCGLAIVLATTLTRNAGTTPQPAPQGDSQVVMLGLKGARYTPDIITVEAGKPVTLKDDGSLRGCAKYVVQRDLGIHANFAQSKEYTFTPTKKGTFTLACSMNMYQGTIQVV